MIGKEQDQVYVILARADVVKINRAPVLTLWAAVVAERLGYEWEEALTLGRAVAGLNAYKKGVSQGPCKPASKANESARGSHDRVGACKSTCCTVRCRLGEDRKGCAR